jgi:hypothetical protein
VYLGSVIIGAAPDDEAPDSGLKKFLIGPVK